MYFCSSFKKENFDVTIIEAGPNPGGEYGQISMQDTPIHLDRGYFLPKTMKLSNY